MTPTTSLLSSDAYSEQYLSPSSLPLTPPAVQSAYPSPRLHHAQTSTVGMIQVLGFTPNQGEQLQPITVKIHFNPHPNSREAVYVRLVVGLRAVTTTVCKPTNSPDGEWRLDGCAPPLDPNHSSSGKVLLSVQALNDSNLILDSVTFAEFTYWNTDSSPVRTCAPKQLDDYEFFASSSSSSPHTPPRLASPQNHSPTAHTLSMPRRKLSDHAHLPTPSPEISNRTIRQPKTSRSKSRPRQTVYARNSTVGRAPKSRFSESDAPLKPVLDIMTPLENMCIGWTLEEQDAGRRLVRFSRVQDGCRIVVSCDPVRQEDYREDDSVISCIYRADADNFYVTSFDVIYLLECICSDRFPVEEKNRIRRNLEGFQPTTLSKQKAKSKAFFQKIMDFPTPKPRNIEKDLKVFEWSVLPDALNNIFSRYKVDLEPITVIATPAPTPSSALAGLPDLPGFSVNMNDHPSPQRTPEFCGKYESPDSPAPGLVDLDYRHVVPDTVDSPHDDSPYMPCVPLSSDDHHPDLHPQMYYDVSLGDSHFPHPNLHFEFPPFQEMEYAHTPEYMPSPELEYLSSPDYPHEGTPEFDEFPFPLHGQYA